MTLKANKEKDQCDNAVITYHLIFRFYDEKHNM